MELETNVKKIVLEEFSQPSVFVRETASHNSKHHFRKGSKTTMLRQKIFTCVVATIIGGLAITETASAETIDCSLTGYTFMGGASAYVSTPSGPPSQKDYFLAQSLNNDMGGANYWGYGWVKFDDIGTTTVGSARLYFDLLGVGSMNVTPATEANPANLAIYSAGDIDVDDLGGSWDLREDLRDNLDATAPLHTIIMTRNGAHSVDITDIYNSWVAGTTANNGLVFADANDDSSGSKYAGFDNASGGAPYISTAFVPEPSSLLLLAMGIGTLALLKKLRRTS